MKAITVEPKKPGTTKPLEQVVLIGRRSFWEPKTALITGAGSVGLLAALFAKLCGLEVHVSDRIEGGPKADLVRELGGYIALAV